MRVARELAPNPAHRVPAFAFQELEESKPQDIGLQKRAWYLRFRITDRPGIIRDLSSILALHGISIDAILQLPDQDKHNLPFVITLEPAPEAAVRHALGHMAELNFMVEPPLAMPIERGI